MQNYHNVASSYRKASCTFNKWILSSFFLLFHFLSSFLSDPLMAASNIFFRVSVIDDNFRQNARWENWENKNLSVAVETLTWSNAFRNIASVYFRFERFLWKHVNLSTSVWIKYFFWFEIMKKKTLRKKMC